MWTSRPTQRAFFGVAFAWILATTVASRPNLETLGLRIPFPRSSLWIVAGGGFLAIVVTAIALALHTLHPLQGAGLLALHMAGYLLWAFEQQFILQDYFLFRLLRILPNEYSAVVGAALLFSTAHIPNPVLMAVTLVFGLASCALFLRYRNLYALGLVHGILGLCVAISVPDAVTHHMTVGLGYLHYHH
jgi:membrane protease YdiL (CAAX protease family)